MSWLTPLMSFSRTAREAKAAAAALGPFVRATERRMGGISPGIWRRSYVVGYITMLITLLYKDAASQDSRRSDPAHALSHVQADAFQRLSGQPAAGVGESICVLSLENDPAFVEGCQNAITFHAALQMSQQARHFVTRHECEDLRARANASEADLCNWAGLAPVELWQQFFDERISA